MPGRIIRILVCIAALLFMASSLEARQIRVAWVPDGDTLILADREVVRLKGIDAPETGYDGEEDQYFAREATQKLEQLISGRDLVLKTGQEPRDRFGRTLGYVYLPDGENLNLILVRKGYAFYYPHPEQDQEIAAAMLEAQQQAMMEGLGFWPGLLGIEEARLQYLGNKRSKRFHGLECGYGRRIAQANRVVFSSLYDAFYEGYAPCRRCSPWPLEIEVAED